MTSAKPSHYFDVTSHISETESPPGQLCTPCPAVLCACRAVGTQPKCNHISLPVALESVIPSVPYCRRCANSCSFPPQGSGSAADTLEMDKWNSRLEQISLALHRRSFLLKMLFGKPCCTEGPRWAAIRRLKSHWSLVAYPRLFRSLRSQLGKGCEAGKQRFADQTSGIRSACMYSARQSGFRGRRCVRSVDEQDTRNVCSRDEQAGAARQYRDFACSVPRGRQFRAENLLTRSLIAGASPYRPLL
jgi:hypothetical protein